MGATFPPFARLGVRLIPRPSSGPDLSSPTFRCFPEVGLCQSAIKQQLVFAKGSVGLGRRFRRELDRGRRNGPLFFNSRFEVSRTQIYLSAFWTFDESRHRHRSL